MNGKLTSYAAGRVVLAVSVLAGLAVAQPAFARGAIGGAGLRGVSTRTLEDDGPALEMKWYDSMEDAIAAARTEEPALPVVCYLRVAAGRADRYITATVFANKTIIEMSHEQFAAFSLDVGVKEAREQALSWGIKNDGALAWFDTHGNCIKKQTGRISFSEILKIVKYWVMVQNQHKKQVDKRVAEAARQLKRGRHIEALGVLRPVSNHEGPLAEGIRPLMQQIEGKGNTLLGRIDAVEHGRTGRDALLRAIADEYHGTAVEERAEEMMQPVREAKEGGGNPGIDDILGATKGGADGGRQAGDSAPSKVAVEIPPGVDADNPQALLIAARVLYTEGKKVYKEDARGGDKAALAKAFGILTQAGDVASLAQEKRPKDSMIARLIISISQLRYSCFKKM